MSDKLFIQAKKFAKTHLFDGSLEDFKANVEQWRALEKAWDRFGEYLFSTPIGEKRVVLPLDDECLEWRHNLSVNGYPTISFCGESIIGSRIAFMYHNQLAAVPKLNIEGESLVVRHLCNNKICMRGSHLQLGTQSDNMKDRILSGDSRRGEENVNSKLTDAIARSIVEDFDDGEKIEDIAEKYDITVTTVKSILGGKSWTDATGLDKVDVESRYVPYRELKMTDEKWDDLARRLQEEKRFVLGEEPMGNATTLCKEWVGSINTSKYGIIHFLNCEILVHVAVIAVENRQWPDEKLLVRHSCNNKICYELSHLSTGTHHDNMVDFMLTNTHHYAKIDIGLANEIVHAGHALGTPVEVLTAKYKIKKTQVVRILHGKHWFYALTPENAELVTRSNQRHEMMKGVAIQIKREHSFAMDLKSLAKRHKMSVADVKQLVILKSIVVDSDTAKLQQAFKVLHPKSYPTSTTDIRKIRKLGDEGKTPEEIVEETGQNEKTVTLQLKKFARKRPISDEPTEAEVEAEKTIKQLEHLNTTRKAPIPLPKPTKFKRMRNFVLKEK